MSGALVTGHWNIPWLRDLPDDWRVVSSKRLFSPRKELARPDDEQLAATQAFGVISQKAYERRVGRRVTQITQNLEKRRHVERDDFVISMRSFEGGLERAWESGCIRSSYVVLKHGEEVLASFFQYLFKSHGYIQALRATSNFTRDGQDLNMSNFALVDIPLPPMDEQVLIARYLDWVDTQVRQFLRAKKKLIALLNEQKQAIIHHAVTRGLDPNVKLKPSGIPWLGEVPEGWEVKRLKTEMRFMGGGTPSKAEASYWNGDIPWVSPKDMKGDIVDDAEDKITLEAVERSATKIVPKDSVLIVVRSGILQRTIPIALCTREVAINQDMRALISKGKLVPGYFVQYVRGCEHMLLADWTKQGATVESIEHQFLADGLIAIPPLEEQKDIVDSIGERSREYDGAVSKIDSEITLVKEFRTRLISDVVTGKLDVSAFAARLPEDLQVVCNGAEMLDEVEDLVGESSDEEISEEAA